MMNDNKCCLFCRLLTYLNTKQHLQQKEQSGLFVINVSKYMQQSTFSDAFLVALYGLTMVLNTYEPQHVVSNNVVFATSKGSDQPMRSLIRAFPSLLSILWMLSY